MYRIYALINDLTNEVFYVGQSKQKDLNKRLQNHIYEAKENKKCFKKAIYLKACNFKISLKAIEENILDQEQAYIREQYYIDLYKPCCNISPAKPNPPKMAGHNKTIFPDKMYDLLGTMPDYKLAEKFNSNKYTIARIRREKGIKSYAEQTGNDGKHKKGIAKGTVKGFYTKVKPEFDALMGTMPDRELAKLAGVGHNCIYKRRNSLNIESFGNNHGRKKSL